MANEAVIIELFDGGRPIRFTCADDTGIEKGTILKLSDPRTASASSADNDPFAGIAAAEKVANDGELSISGYTCGIFDILTAGAITVGATVNISTANTVNASAAADLLTGSVVGKALEACAGAEVIAVAVGVYQ